MQAHDAITPRLSPARCRVVHAWLGDDAHARLAAAADRRRIHPDQLVAALVEAVLRQPDPDKVIDVLLER